jgi:hypothetical protein
VLGIGQTTPPSKTYLLNASTKASEWESKDYKDSCLEFGFGTWKVRAVLRPELLKELIPQMK